MTRHRDLAMLAAALAVLLTTPFASAWQDQDQDQDQDAPRKTVVGMVGRFKELKLPGSELEVVPIEDRDTPLVVRIVRTFPHGTDFRYEIEYYGLEPGEYDLREYLRRADGSEVSDLPTLKVSVVPELPEGRLKPNALESRGTPELGGYQQLLIGGAVVWVIGLLMILFWRKGSRSDEAAKPAPPKSLAERLRPLVDRAVAGDASHAELATLERSLLTYWQKRLNLQGQSPSEMIRALRSHPEAGGLMSQLEAWLHQPESQADLDVEALLKPYRNVPEKDLDFASTTP